MGHVRFGFAARCAAVAMPRRQQPRIIPGLCPCFGVSPSDLLEQTPHHGRSPKCKSHLYGGAEPPTHIWRQSRSRTNEGLFRASYPSAIMRSIRAVHGAIDIRTTFANKTFSI